MNPATITTLETLCEALNSLAGAAPDYPGDLVSKVIETNGWEDLQHTPYDVCAHGGRKVTMRENPVEWQPLFYITEHDVEEVPTQADETYILKLAAAALTVSNGTIADLFTQPGDYLVAFYRDGFTKASILLSFIRKGLGNSATEGAIQSAARRILNDLVPGLFICQMRTSLSVDNHSKHGVWFLSEQDAKNSNAPFLTVNVHSSGTVSIGYALEIPPVTAPQP